MNGEGTNSVRLIHRKLGKDKRQAGLLTSPDRRAFPSVYAQ